MLPKTIQDLVDQLSKLPDIGPRAATRLAFFLINQEQYELDKLSFLIKNLKNEIKLCPQCFNIASNGDKLCAICKDHKRNPEIVCLIENILNILPIERTKQYNGLYHVLGGLISPSNKIGPDNLQIQELINRIKTNQPQIKEIIFALSPTTEGDTTTLYIERILNPLNIKTTRLARGLSTGSDLNYADENTLTNAILGRR
ncbi:MAG: recombination mediator RecR [bacterium]